MPEISIDVQIWCGTCGEGLCHLADEHRGGGGLDVEACPTCVQNAHDEGYNERDQEED